MPRYKLTVEYQGTGFAGWQRQSGQPSVQQKIEQAVAAFSGETVTLQAAGRTDAGVHALGQVAHVDLATEHRPDTVRDAINAHLRPHRVAIVAAEPVDQEFEARFSALARHYRYRIVNRRAPLTVDRDLAWLVPKPLDSDAMHQAAQSLVGTHDFTTFRSSECQAKSPVKTLDRIEVRRLGAEIEISCSARSFLHNQVRSFVGSLKRVGEGKWSAGDLRAALEAVDRTRCGPVAPPDGLYLVRVDYPA